MDVKQRKGWDKSILVEVKLELLINNSSFLLS